MLDANFLKWQSGRQSSGYEKLLLLTNPFIIPFDCYLLRFREGAAIAEHTDPVDGKKHYRVNVILRAAIEGGEFICNNTIINWSRLKLFRPDLAPHAVTPVSKGTRYVLSIGWVLK